MELFIAILTIGCSLYIYKNLVVICIDIIPDLLGDISRSEDTNDLIKILAVFILPCIALVILFFLLDDVLGDDTYVAIVLIAFYFKFGTDKGVLK